MGVEVFNLLFVTGEPELHVIGHAVHVQGLVTECQDAPRPVVARNDDKPLVGVEDVVSGFGDFDGTCFGMQQIDLS